MKQQLKYSKDAIVKGFVTNMDYATNNHVNAQNRFNQNFALDNRPLSQQTINSIQEQTDFVFCLSNNCRENYKPVFADETQYLQVSKGSINSSDIGGGCSNPANDNDTTLPVVFDLTTPPNTKDDSIILKSILIGSGVFILLNLFTE
jgi:hypothetical protein